MTDNAHSVVSLQDVGIVRNCLRKGKDIKYDRVDEVDEKNAPESIRYDKANKPCPVLKSVSNESIKEHKTHPRKKQRKQKKDAESISSVLPCKSDLTVNDTVDVLATNTNWIGAELVLSPPDDVT